jgi:hypothetical protein
LLISVKKKPDLLAALRACYKINKEQGILAHGSKEGQHLLNFYNSKQKTANRKPFL